jgi:DNA primase
MVGYSPDSRNGLKKFLNTRGFEDKELLKWGLLVERNGIFVDKFRNRLLQPIFNLQGDVAGFSGRYVGESKLPPKYLNSPETLLYKKQEMLYGFFQGKESIRKNNFVILVEGNIDILSSHRVGVENIAAPLGTSFTLNQAALIKRFAEEVYFCFDTDSAGTKALIRALEIVESIGLKHRVIDITGFQDADELIVKNQNLWSLKVQNSVNTVDYILKKFSSDLNMDSIDGKTQFYSRILPVLKIIKDEVLLSYLIKEVSILVEISEQAVKEKLDKGLQTLRLRPQSPEVATGNSASITPRKSVSSSRKLEAYFLILLIQLDNFQKYRGMEQYFQDENCLNIYKALVNLSDDSDFSVVSDMLDEEGKSQLEEIVLFDTSKISSPENELQEVYQRMAKIYLKKEILKLRKSLSDDSENQQIVEKLSEYTMKLKNL